VVVESVDSVISL